MKKKNVGLYGHLAPYTDLQELVFLNFFIGVPGSTCYTVSRICLVAQCDLCHKGNLSQLPITWFIFEFMIRSLNGESNKNVNH